MYNGFMRLPAIIGDQWINSQPLTPDNLAGKVVLIDFWTYSCVNCQRTLPYLKTWWQKYQDHGLVIIGIHAPEFEFEKDFANVTQATKDLGVGWPVVLDNEHINWTNFANHYWPAKYLGDREGKIVYSHFGEGSYTETETEIQKLLQTSSPAPMPAVATDEHEHGSVCFLPTPETYCGYLRGRLASQRYVEDSVTKYEAPAQLSDDSIALNGKFLAAAEYVQSQEPSASLQLKFHATEVNLVLHTADKTATVDIALNGKPIPKSIRGHAVDAKSQVTVTKPTLYNLVKSNDLVQGTLQITAKSGHFQAYAFTFSGCES